MFTSKKLITAAAALFFATSSLHAVSATNKPTHASRKRVAPFLMPDTHPIKAELDAFFQQERWTFSDSSMKKAGFSSWKPRNFSHVIVAKHDLFPGYYFKIYLDTQRFSLEVPESEIWALRVEGANMAQAVIDEMGWEAYMKVPKKWIYKLPHHPKPSKGYLPKHYILVQEDMDLLSAEDNKKKWKSDEVTFDDLARVYHVIDSVGLWDCAKIHNVPFAKDGRIAFIDTQGHKTEGDKGREVTWDSLDEMLSPANKKFWKQLRKN